MADPRRSARSTKGVNPRLNEPSPSPAPPSSGKRRKTTPAAAAASSKSQSPGAADEDADKDGADDIIRCVCGAKEEDEDDDRMMIQCEGCDAWQHTQCMAITKKKIPKQYFCEICRPDQHAWLLEQMAKGERPWENPKGAARLRAAAERKQHLEEEKRQKEEEAAKLANGGSTESQPEPEPESMDIDAEPSTNDREATIPAEESPKPETPAPKPRRGVEDVQEKVKDVELNKRKSLPNIVTQSPAPRPRARKEGQTPKSAKRKAGEDSDTEYQDDDTKEPDKKLRRTSVPSVASPGTKESSVPPKTPRGDHSRRQSTAALAAQKPKEDMSPQTELVSSVEELRSSTRQKTVAFLNTYMSESAKKLVQSNQLELPNGENLRTVIQSRALQIEHHVYMNHFDGDRLAQEYSKRMRSIGVNLKQNLELTNEVLSGRLSCERLSRMTPEDMQSKELREFTQKALLESEKQHTLINTDTGPRIRRTHKGEELVDDFNTTSEDTLLDTGPIVRRNTEQLDETPPLTGTSAPPESPKTLGGTSMSPISVSATHTPRSTSQPATPADAQTTSVSTETATTEPARKFSIENVWSHVETPDASSRSASQFRPPPLQTPAPAGTKIDRDIDALLKDDDATAAPTGTPPYSPKPFSPETRFSPPNTPHWRGTITMNAIASVSAVATLLGGPPGVGSKAWPELLDNNLNIDGRIKLDRATEYLCGQKFSRSSSLITALLHPSTSSSATAAEFQKLYDYFSKKDRYAVVGKHQLQCIKDLYIVPCDIENKGLPDWFSVLDPQPNESEIPRGKCLVLVFVVIRALVDGPQHHQQSMVQQQTPIQQHHHQQQMGMGLTYGTPAQPMPSPYTAPPGPQHMFANHSPLPPQHHPGMYQPSPGAHPQAQFNQPTPPHHHQSPPQQPPHLQQPQHQSSYIPVHPMTKELIQMVPGLGELQIRAIDRLLQENPALQTQPEVLAKEVEKVLGAEQG